MTLVVLMLATCPAHAQPLRPPDDTQRTLENSVVLISAVSQDYDYRTPWKKEPLSRSLGTGFVIGPDIILTNAHNVSNNRYVELKKQNRAQRYSAAVAFIAHDCDLALLKVADPTFFADTIALEFGGLPALNSTVSTCGFPLGGRQVSVTEGVVSRIQTDVYSHSAADAHLVIQTDAAINPGNSGGPVLQNGKVVGVAFQGMTAAENIGYMIPTTVVRHFLKDIEDGIYDSYGSVGFSYCARLHNPAYADYLKVPPGRQGIVVLSTLLHSSVESIFLPGDVITGIDDYDIDNDGNISIYGLTLDLSEAIEAKQIGESVTVTFFRQGQSHTETVAIGLNRPVLEYARQYDRQPGYVVFAGLTFAKLSRNYLQTWPSGRISDLPHPIRYLFQFATQIDRQPERKEYVVLSEILTDSVNAYTADFKDQVLQSINDIPIWSLDDISPAFERPTGDFHLIRFMYRDQPLIIRAEQARIRHPEILKRYQIPVAQHYGDTL